MSSNGARFLACSRVGFLVAASACLAGLGEAQWSVTSLHPTGQSSTEARGASGTVQVGDYYLSTERACMWNGTASSWVSLDPPGSAGSMALGASATNQVGWANVGGRVRASLWSGSAASWVNLNPAGALQSQALGAFGGNQVGWIYDGVLGRASLWSGTAASWVDLHPASTAASEASAVRGDDQAGWAVVNGVFHASLWSGTAASWVDLHPAGAFQSEARGIADGYQVGVVDGHASLWTGTAASWVDLNPAATISSELYAAYGSVQVGAAQVAGWDHASAWSGTAESWVDLHALLSADFRYSYALAVSSDGVDYHVAGLGYNTFEGRFEALLWTRPVEAVVAVVPDSFFVTRGTSTSGGVLELAESDGQYLSLSPELLRGRFEDVLTVGATASMDMPSALEFTLEARVSRAAGTVDQEIELFNYETGEFETLATSAATTTDSVMSVTPAGDPARFVQAGTGAMQARIRHQYSLPGWLARSINLLVPFRTSVDQVSWNVTM